MVEIKITSCTTDELKEFLTGCTLAKKGLGWGHIFFEKDYNVSKYHGKYGEGYAVKYGNFKGKDGRLWHHMDIYTTTI